MPHCTTYSAYEHEHNATTRHGGRERFSLFRNARYKSHREDNREVNS